MEPMKATSVNSRAEELFQNVALKMDLKTAVERGVLVPIRCIRVKTNIDPDRCADQRHQIQFAGSGKQAVHPGTESVDR